MIIMTTHSVSPMVPNATVELYSIEIERDADDYNDDDDEIDDESEDQHRDAS